MSLPNVPLTNMFMNPLLYPLQTKTTDDEGFKVDVRLSELDASKKTDPEEIDLEIHGARVLIVLDRAIDQIKVMASLQKLLCNNAEILRKYFNAQEVEFIAAVCAKHVEGVNPKPLMDKSELFKKITNVMDKIAINEHVFKNKRSRRRSSFGKNEDAALFDPHLSHIMGMLWSCEALREAVLSKFTSYIDEQTIMFIECIKNLRDIAQKKLAVSATEDRNRERELQKSWKSNTEMEEKIKIAKAQLDKQRDELGRQLEINKEKVEEYMIKIKELQENFADDIKRKVHDSETVMNADTLDSKEKQVELAEEAKNTTQQYEALVTQHLAFEKGLRAKRFKVETQLCSWLAKYDADIGERQAQFEEVTKGYEDEKAEMDALQEKFNQQTEEYVELMTEKEEEERRIYEAKAYVFLCNRAARRIQRCWREYLQRKIDKKNAKKAAAKAKLERAEAAKNAGPKEKKGGKKKKGDA